MSTMGVKVSEIVQNLLRKAFVLFLEEHVMGKNVSGER